MTPELYFILKNQFDFVQQQLATSFPVLLEYPMLQPAHLLVWLGLALALVGARVADQVTRWRLKDQPHLLGRFGRVMLPGYVLVSLLLLKWFCSVVGAPLLLVDIAILVAGFWATPKLVKLLLGKHPWNRYVTLAVWLVLLLSALDQLDGIILTLEAVRLTLGQFTISAWDIIKAIIVFFVLAWAMKRGTDLLNTVVSKRTNVNPAALALFTKTIYVFGIIAITLITLNILGVDLTAIAFFAGALGIGLGFGLRAITSNFISGIFMVLDKSIKPGDVISVDGTYGVVKNMYARYIVMRRRDDVEVLIPNENLMTENVINWSYSNKLLRNDLPLKVSFDTDLDQVRDILVRVAQAHPRVVKDPGPRMLVVAFGEYGIELFLRYWITDPENGLRPVASDLYLGVWREFKAAGIRIPYPTEVHHVVPGDGVKKIKE